MTPANFTPADSPHRWFVYEKGCGPFTGKTSYCSRLADSKIGRAAPALLCRALRGCNFANWPTLLTSRLPGSERQKHEYFIFMLWCDATLFNAGDVSGKWRQEIPIALCARCTANEMCNSISARTVPALA